MKADVNYERFMNLYALFGGEESFNALPMVLAAIFDVPYTVVIDDLRILGAPIDV